MGVEPTIRPAKDRIAGFEGREDHRTLFASTFTNYTSQSTYTTHETTVVNANTSGVSANAPGPIQ